MTQYLFANNATTTLAQDLSSTSTVINVASGDGALFPSITQADQAFAVSMVDAQTGLITEICYCTARSGDQLTVTRGQEGTTARAWSAGDTCANYITADVIESWLQTGTADERYLRLSSTSQQSVTGGVFVDTLTTDTPTDVPGTNTGNNVPDTYWVDKWFTPRTVLSDYVTGTGTSGNFPIRNVQLGNAPTEDTTSAYLQAQTTWGVILFPSQLNVATQISNYAQPKGDYAQTQWVKDNYAATEYVQQNYALTTQLPLPADMHVQVFTTIIPVGTPCGYNQSPYVIPLPKPFTTFVGALGGDGGSNIFTLSCAPSDNSHVNVWCQSPQYPSGPTAGDVSIIITAYGYY